MLSPLPLDENICCEYSLEVPRRGASNEYPQHMFSSTQHLVRLQQFISIGLVLSRDEYVWPIWDTVFYTIRNPIIFCRVNTVIVIPLCNSLKVVHNTCFPVYLAY